MVVVVAVAAVKYIITHTVHILFGCGESRMKIVAVRKVK